MSALPPTSPTDFPAEPWRSASVPPEPPDGDLAFTCPRCAEEVRQVAYGPCPTCRDALRDALGGVAREVTEVDYVPKMNVTPNAVAVKE